MGGGDSVYAAGWHCLSRTADCGGGGVGGGGQGGGIVNLWEFAKNLHVIFIMEKNK